jgi:hypothetical protein
MSNMDLLRRARAAIASQDEPAALQLLRELAEGDSQADLLAQPVGDALIATARGSRRDAADRAALTMLKRIEQTRDHIIQLLDSTPFGGADLAAIREVVGALEAKALQVAERALDENKQTVGGEATPARRVGSVWLELKYIRDAGSGRTYGPYMYGRWRESGRKRSKYIGKPDA